MVNRYSLGIFALTIFVLLILPGVCDLSRLYVNIPEETVFVFGPVPSDWQILISGFRDYHTLTVASVISLVFTLIATKFARNNLIGDKRVFRLMTAPLLTLFCTSLYFLYRMVWMLTYDKEIYGFMFGEIQHDTLILAALFLLISVPCTLFLRRLSQNENI